jgi:hypothetical protein
MLPNHKNSFAAINILFYNDDDYNNSNWNHNSEEFSLLGYNAI